MRIRTPFLVLSLLIALASVQLGRSAVGLFKLWEIHTEGVDALELYSRSPIPRPSGAQLRVVFHGDSRAQEWQTPADVAGVEFLNRGVGGETSAETRNRFTAHVAPLEPDVVVIQTCVNQLKMSSMLPWRRLQFADQCVADLANIIVQAERIGAHVVVTTVFPIRTPSAPYNFFYPSGLREVIASANERIRTLQAPNLTILDVTPLLSAEDGTLRREYAQDWIHLSRAGYSVLNEQLVPLLPPR